MPGCAMTIFTSAGNDNPTAIANAIEALPLTDVNTHNCAHAHVSDRRENGSGMSEMTAEITRKWNSQRDDWLSLKKAIPLKGIEDDLGENRISITFPSSDGRNNYLDMSEFTAEINRNGNPQCDEWLSLGMSEMTAGITRKWNSQRNDWLSLKKAIPLKGIEDDLGENQISITFPSSDGRNNYLDMRRKWNSQRDDWLSLKKAIPLKGIEDDLGENRISITFPLSDGRNNYLDMSEFTDKIYRKWNSQSDEWLSRKKDIPLKGIEEDLGENLVYATFPSSDGSNNDSDMSEFTAEINRNGKPQCDEWLSLGISLKGIKEDLGENPFMSELAKIMRKWNSQRDEWLSRKKDIPLKGIKEDLGENPISVTFPSSDGSNNDSDMSEFTAKINRNGNPQCDEWLFLGISLKGIKGDLGENPVMSEITADINRKWDFQPDGWLYRKDIPLKGIEEDLGENPVSLTFPSGDGRENDSDMSEFTTEINRNWNSQCDERLSILGISLKRKRREDDLGENPVPVTNKRKSFAANVSLYP